MAPLGRFGGSDPSVAGVSGETGTARAGDLMQAARDLLNPSPEGNPVGAEQAQGFYMTAHVYNSAAISIADSTLVTLTFNSELYDNGGLHSTTVNTSRLTAPLAGKYIIFGNVEWATAGTGKRQIRIRLNGVTDLVHEQDNAVPGDTHEQFAMTLENLAANDYVELLCLHNNGAPMNVNAVNNTSLHFIMGKYTG